MDAGTYSERTEFRSRLSFAPLIRAWEEIAANEDGIPAKICGQLAEKFSKHQELTEAIDDYALLEQHKQLIEEAMATIFPASLSQERQLSAVAVPFSNMIIHASQLFALSFMEENSNQMRPLDLQVEDNIAKAKEQLAYKLILKTFYHLEIAGGDSFICAYPDPSQDIHNYFELNWHTQFIEVATTMPLPALPKDFLKCYCVDDLPDFPEIKNILPLNEFIFDGIVLIYVNQVTERETINKIKEILLEERVLEDTALFSAFKEQLSYLIQNEEVQVGYSVFNNSQVFRLLRNSSILLKNTKTSDKERLYKALLSELQRFPHYIWRENAQSDGPISRCFKKEGWKNALLSALYHNNEIIGCLEICTKTNKAIDSLHIAKVEQVTELLQNALQRYGHYLQNQVNRLVKEYFTSVQSSVEWKFNQTVMDFLIKQQVGEQAVMQSILFDNVYPLYGSIDIRNSSGERNLAVQQDMTQQLQWLKKILLLAQEQKHLSFLDEILIRIDEYISSISNFLFATEEQAIQDFLKWEAVELLGSVQELSSEIGKQVDDYFKALDHPIMLLHTRQRQFEESITAINNYITEFLQEEQQEAQQIFPHYFERFVTDGVEINIFIGQSIAPYKKFSKLYLKNMQLWLLTFLAQAAQQTQQLSSRLPVPLATTQLILLHHDPISVQFRTEERKFDVEGMYNVRYEVIKKRIDKALVKGTNERLTRPGTIAIIYSSGKEAREFIQHIQFLKNQQLLEGETEMLELEEMQGVSGLKALRVQVCLKQEELAMGNGQLENKFENEQIRE